MGRTVVDATTAEHAHGGIGVVIRGLLDGVETLGLGDDVVVVHGPSLHVPAGVGTLQTRMVSRRYGRLAYQRLLVAADRRLAKLDADRLLTMDSYISIVPVPGIRRRDCFIHDVLPITHPQFFSRAGLVPKRIGLATSRWASAVFTSSGHTATRIQQHLGVTAVPVRFGCGQLQDEEADALLSEPPERPGGYYVYVGAVEERKDLRTLVLALTMTRRPGLAPAKLAIVGNYHTPEGLRLRCWAKGVAGDQVRFLGRLSGADTRQLVRRATALVYPSRAEGFGLPVLEGMALGTPVVASSIPEIRSWAGDACLYFEAGNAQDLATAMEEAAGDAGHEAAARGRALSEGYRWRQFAARLLAA